MRITHRGRAGRDRIVGSVQPVATAIVWLLACSFITFAQSDTRTKTVRTLLDLNNDLLRVHAQIREAGEERAKALTSEAASILRARSIELNAVLREDPKRALSLAFSAELLADLAAKFSDSADLLETHGVCQGAAQRWSFEYPNRSSRTITRITTGFETLDLYFADSEPALNCNSVLQAEGIRLGSAVVVTNSTVSSASSALTCSTAGAQSIAALLVTFPGVTPPANVTTQSVHDLLFGTTGQSVDGFWRDASHGQTWATGDVFGWFTLPATYDCSQISTLFNDALTVAANSGVNFQNYTRIYIVVPDFGCGWSGLASIGCSSTSSPNGTITASTSYVNASFVGGQPRNSVVQLMAHEGGHNLGLDHAHSLTFSTGPLGPLGTTGTDAEYGDLFSDMSNQLTEHYAAYHKAALLNWMAAGTNYQVVQSSGTWSLQPVEQSPAGLQALKVQRGTGNNAWLWIEYRQPIGSYDSSSPVGSQIFTGALIHYDDGSGSLASHLLDFSAANTSGLGPALSAGQTWVDPYSNLSITVQGATASALTVTINYGASSCTRGKPGITMSPANPSVAAGSNVSYTVLLTNNDSAGCGANTFGLASTQPGGWTGNFSASSLTLSPGASGSVTLIETVPAGTAASTYSITSSASSGSNNASASANVSVTAPSTLTDSLTATYSRKIVAATATIISGGVPVAGATVNFTLTKSNGSKVNGTAATDANGHASWSYRIAEKDPSGSYSIGSAATYKSQTATSNSVVFSVQ